MNEQPSLMYGGTTGFVTGSDTSKAHAEFEKKRASGVQGRILELIIQAGQRGHTSEEVEVLTGWKHQSVSSSIRNMELGGKVVKTIQVRDNQHSYVSAGEAALMKPEALLAPNPVRSWKKKHDALVGELEENWNAGEALANGLGDLVTDLSLAAKVGHIPLWVFNEVSVLADDAEEMLEFFSRGGKYGQADSQD